MHSMMVARVLPWRSALLCLAIGLSLTSCSDGSATGAPTILDTPVVAANPNSAMPLAAMLTLTTDIPARVIATIEDGADIWKIRFTALATNHDLPLLGFKPGRTSSISIDVEGADGARTTYGALLSFVAPPLPGANPGFKLDATNYQPGLMEPGVTWFIARRYQPSVVTAIYAVDKRGQVVWYYNVVGEQQFLINRMMSGNFMVLMTSQYSPSVVVGEMTLLGDVLRRWGSFSVAVPNGVNVPGPKDYTHDQLELPSGNMVVLPRDPNVTIPNYHVSRTDPTLVDTVTVNGDYVLEFDPNTGETVHQCRLLDILDPTRVGFGGVAQPGATAGSYNNPDWSHVNSVFVDYRDDTYIVSLPSQDAVIKIDRATCALKWILGNHYNWPAALQPKLLTPITGGISEDGPLPSFWQWFQHNATLTPTGNVLLFDNGNNRTAPYSGVTPVADADNHSRSIEYEIDETNMTVRIAWQYTPSEPLLYSGVQGGTQLLPATGNVLVNFSWPTFGDTSKVRIIEVTHDPTPVVLFDLAFNSPDLWTLYRATRMPLYPPDVATIIGLD